MKQITFIASMFIAISIARAEWELLLATHNMSGVTALETDGGRLFAGIGRGLYTSDDNGDTWCTTALTHGYVQAIAISGDVIYAFVYELGMFRSDDYGKTWNPKNNGFPIVHDHTLDIRLPSIEQILVTSSGMVLAVGGLDGTYISRDRGETWHFAAEWLYPCRKSPDIPDFTISDQLVSMTEYDGYWWAASVWYDLYRSPDNGATWECLGQPLSRGGGAEPRNWLVLNNQLYVGELFGAHGFARWNEGELAMEDLSDGLPDSPYMTSLAVNRGRIFAGLSRGVYMYDQGAETWTPVGLNGSFVLSLVSHQSYLYVAVSRKGIYRASIPIVHSYGKAAATWGAVKTK